MEIQACIEQFMQDNLPPEILSRPLPDAAAGVVVEHLKNEADRYWLIDPRRSLELADRIISIGEARLDASQTALVRKDGDVRTIQVTYSTPQSVSITVNPAPLNLVPGFTYTVCTAVGAVSIPRRSVFVKDFPMSGRFVLR